MAIHFVCPYCTQTISVDESKVRETAECPHCNFTVKVPAKSTREPPPSVSQFSAVTPAPVPQAVPDLVIRRRSAWSTFFQIIGIFCILGGIIGLAAEWRNFWKGGSPEAF